MRQERSESVREPRLAIYKTINRNKYCDMSDGRQNLKIALVAFSGRGTVSAYLAVGGTGSAGRRCDLCRGPHDLHRYSWKFVSVTLNLTDLLVITAAR